MRLKAIVARGGILAGDEFERPDHIAIRMIADGSAVPVSERKIERAVAAPARETRDPFDHDGDGKPGGSLPKRKRKK